jgi:hypothetical protein
MYSRPADPAELVAAGQTLRDTVPTGAADALPTCFSGLQPGATRARSSRLQPRGGVIHVASFGRLSRRLLPGHPV